MTAKIKNLPQARHKTKPKGISKQAFEKVYWPYLPIILIIGLLVGLGNQSGALQSSLRHPVGRVLDYATSMNVGSLLADTNAYRNSNNVSPLRLNEKLNAAAVAKANDMATRNYWSHTTPEGQAPWVFVSSQGYTYQKLGENLAAGFENEQATVNGWISSPPHRENLINSAYQEVGFGVASSADYTSAGGGPMTIVVAFYGLPLPVAADKASEISTTPPKNTNVSTTSPPTSSNSAPQPSSAVVEKDVKPSIQPVTTETLKAGGVTLSLRTSLAQIAFAAQPLGSLIAGFATFVMFAAGGLWLSRHLLTLRRVLLDGQKFVIKHPLIDVGLLFIAILAYLLTRTAGLIQ